MPRRVSRLVPFLCLPLLAACVGNPSDFDFDFRNNGISRGGEATAPRPAPDANGLITYETYQVVVARGGDTVADVATRIGIAPEELASFNGRRTTDPLRADEVLALPRRVNPRGGGTDIASIAGAAIDAAEANAPAPAVQVQPGAEPVRHRVGRGETAFSIARLYGVSVSALAEWNGLGPELAVREGQFLIIPLVIESEGAAPTAPAATSFGESVAPLPPSSAAPLPGAIEQATLPDVSAPAPTPSVPELPPETSDAPAAAPAAPAPAATEARLIRPVEGPVIRPFAGANEGIDIGAATGTPVRAADDGTVAAITQNTDQIPILVVRHSDGLLTVYANIQNVRVERGDTVSRGQTVAEVGGGDPSFLHFEVRRGMAPVDPGDFLP